MGYDSPIYTAHTNARLFVHMITSNEARPRCDGIHHNPNGYFFHILELCLIHGPVAEKKSGSGKFYKDRDITA
ncbi:hypothetical protein PDIG_12240 [Penicillium digitatum PHI26]|uniref:Uncharacterized protein n=2 Tax=Penicillium digitatum TaxID=36651 RepID=K9GTV7_PEND2|nr:hypothetical protein PDIP_38460 [Penicillium digitatum Pd1]EKV15863.1 hypothetical protein PDIP_38460 [Penicillium digitatum Pd1]EKV18053.1 hypothetical protein PDIG_12240 [Penicillium digitatum PHI26]